MIREITKGLAASRMVNSGGVRINWMAKRERIAVITKGTTQRTGAAPDRTGGSHPKNGCRWSRSIALAAPLYHQVTMKHALRMVPGRYVPIDLRESFPPCHTINEFVGMRQGRWIGSACTRSLGAGIRRPARCLSPIFVGGHPL